MAERQARLFDANCSLDTALNVSDSQECAQNLVQWKPFPDLRKTFSKNLIFSPLDRFSRSGKQQRAVALGLTSAAHSSFEGNQSFPRLASRRKKVETIRSSSKAAKSQTMDRIRGDGLHSFSFAPGRARGSFTPGPDRPQSGMDSWSLLSSSLASTPAPTSLHTSNFPSNVLNPNKAVFTVDAKTSQILMVNDMACRLLGYSADELSNMALRELFRKQRTPQMSLSEAQQLDLDGNMIVCSGKVVEMVTREQAVLPVSLWLRRIAQEGDGDDERCLAVVEPVVRKEARLLLDAAGRVLTADAEACLLFQHEPADMIGLPLTTLIPAVQVPLSGQPLPKEIRKQKATGRTKDGTSFPLSLRLKESLNSDEVDNANTSMLYSATLWVFTSMSGLIAVSDDGTVESCNHHFANMMFGYAQDELVGKPISLVIPNFCEDLERVDGSGVVSYEDDYEDEEEEEGGAVVLGLGESLPEDARRCESPDNNNSTPPKLVHSFHQLTLHSPKHKAAAAADVVVCKIPHASVFSLGQEDSMMASTPPKKQQSSSCSLDCLEAPSHSTPIRRPSGPPQPRCMSATEMRLLESSHASQRFADGSYIGFGRHRDGASIDIVYQVKKMQLTSGRCVFCVWVSRDPEEATTEGGNCITLTSSFNSTVDNSLGQAIRTCAQQQQQQNGLSVMEAEYCAGDYSKHYAAMQQIGKGAFGCVKMAYRKQDGLLVITKFIEKSKVYQESWVDDAMLGRKVPLEISLLTALSHPNIVQVMDVFENDLYFQMVMRKHGSGMDLFEFIDRDPELDEPLASYIFRQIVSAVEYLHSLQILHRDLKDENVILDHNFHVKLIDFGSATFMSEDRLFSTFYGTVEYCSPEVLAGNKYAGPELEVWSLGVTLYIMAFGENPFYDIDETMKAEMHPPYDVSPELMQLLNWMLAKDPRERCRLSQLVQHPWLHIPCDPRNYRFEDVIQCTAMEAHPPTYYSELVSETAGGGPPSLSVSGLGAELSPSRRRGGFRAGGRSDHSSHSTYSVTTIENFDDEEYDTQDKPATLESDSMDEHVPGALQCEGKVEHLQEESEQLETKVWRKSTPPQPFSQPEDTSLDYYEEDSFS